jgi:hypothetical protein
MARLPQIDLSEHTKHHFADGLYIRELFRPAGTTIVGKTHKKAHFYIVLSGIVTVVGDGKRETYEAPAIIKSLPGTKRAVFAHTDAICITVHPTDSQDLQRIEAELIEPDDLALCDEHNRPKQPALESP